MITEIPLHLLDRSDKSRKLYETYISVCNKNKDKLPTDAWLIPTTLTHESKRTLAKIVKSHMNDKSFIVKLQKSNNESQNEVNVTNILGSLHHPNIAVTICSFQCSDDIKLYTKEHIPSGFCNGNLQSSDNYTIMINKYYELGNTKEFPLDTDTLISIMLQVSMTLIELHQSVGLVHNDLIPGNIFLDTTDREFITYMDKLKVKTNGIIAVISDFGLSHIGVKSNIFTEPGIIREIHVLMMLLTHYNSGSKLPFNLDRLIHITGFQELIKLFIEFKLIEV